MGTPGREVWARVTDGSLSLPVADEYTEGLDAGKVTNHTRGTVVVHVAKACTRRFNPSSPHQVHPREYPQEGSCGS